MTAAEWRSAAEAVRDAELAEFRRRICVAPAHVGTCAIGRCGRCGGGTSSSSQQICSRCAQELGVCPFDQRMVGWGSVSEPEGEAIAVCWLALLMRGHSAERIAGKKALQSFPLEGLAEAAAELEHQGSSSPRSPATAEFIVGFRGAVPEGFTEGARFLNGAIVSVSPALGFVVVRTPDAVRFEEQAAVHPLVRYVELNAGGGHPPWD